MKTVLEKVVETEVPAKRTSKVNPWALDAHESAAARTKRLGQFRRQFRNRRRDLCPALFHRLEKKEKNYNQKINILFVHGFPGTFQP